MAPPPQPPALSATLDLLQLMVPEQLRSAVVQQHVQSQVVWGSLLPAIVPSLPRSSALRRESRTFTLVPMRATLEIMSSALRVDVVTTSVLLDRPREARW